jgi:KUP system potassium uptake protein
VTSKIRKLKRPGSLEMETLRKKQVTCSGKLRDCVLISIKGFKGRLLLYLAYQSIGMIYGDIGSSPLYVYSSTFTSEPSHEDLVGVFSGKEVSMLLSKSGKIV